MFVERSLGYAGPLSRYLKFRIEFASAWPHRGIEPRPVLFFLVGRQVRKVLSKKEYDVPLDSLYAPFPFFEELLLIPLFGNAYQWYSVPSLTKSIYAPGIETSGDHLTTSEKSINSFTGKYSSFEMLFSLFSHSLF